MGIVELLYYVAAMFHGVYSTLCSFVPSQTSSVHLQVQRLEYHILMASAIVVACSTHSLHKVRHKCVPWTDKMKCYAQMTNI